MSESPLPPPWPHPAYRVETPRLVVRCYDPADAQALKDEVDRSREHLSPWMPWARGEAQPTNNYVELIRTFRGNFDLGTDFIYGMFDADTGRLVGGCGLHPRVGRGAMEIGYWTVVDRVGEGLATETSGALTRVGFEVFGAKRLEIRCEPDNKGSAAIPPKLGYVREGILRGSLAQPDGEMRDTAVYGMTLGDYLVGSVRERSVRAFGVTGGSLL